MFKDGGIVGNFTSCDSLTLHKWLPKKKVHSSLPVYGRARDRS